MGVAELHRLKQLEKENTRLKRLVADLSLDKHMLICRGRVPFFV
jgi:putative transposase